jgi:serine/threonine protein kinase
MVQPAEPYGRTIGRYVLYDEIGAGGMATVHLGRMIGSAGFSRTVAIKRLHPHCARDPQFTTLFLDEAHLTAHIQHTNVAAMLDVVSVDDELLLVMEYIHGETLSRLMALVDNAGGHVAPRIAVAILIDVLRGLHAAHEAKTDLGERLDIIHRDVTPQNVIVGADGITRLVDFGVAKAASRLQVTGEGQIKGKFAYMSPEQLQGGKIDRRADIYSASVVLWETLVGRRLFAGNNPGNIVTRVLEMVVEPPSTHAKDVPPALDDVVMRGLSRDAPLRFATAEEMALAIEAAMAPATAREVSQWVGSIATERLALRRRLLSSIASITPSLRATEPSPDPSQIISTISVAMSKPKTKLRSVVALAAIGIALVASAGIVMGRAVTHPRGEAAPSTTQSLTSPTATATLISSAAPIASAAVSRAPIIVAPSLTRTRRGPLTTQSSTGPSTAAPNCSPPYTVDPSDPRIHVAKPECL